MATPSSVPFSSGKIGRTKGVFALGASRQSACRVYPPAPFRNEMVFPLGMYTLADSALAPDHRNHKIIGTTNGVFVKVDRTPHPGRSPSFRLLRNKWTKVPPRMTRS